MLRIFLVLLLMLLVSACASREPGFYKHSPGASALIVPPDLTQPEFEDTFDVPQIAKLLSKEPLLSDGSKVKLVRDGRLRWMEISARPDLVWEHVKDYWYQQRIELEWENPTLGLMETTWIEHPASEYAKDRFRVRIEPTADNKTWVFIAHRGVQEVFADGDLHSTWGPRLSDPELEIEVMGQLLEFLSLEPKRVKAMQEKAKRERPDSVLKLDAEPPSLEVETSFARTWQLVAMAVDRLGHIIESRNKDAGKLVIRLSEDTDSAISGGLFAKREKLTLRFKELGEEKTQIWLEDEEGQVDQSEEAKNMLIRLKENLR